MLFQRQLSTASSNADDVDKEMECTLNNINELDDVIEAYEFADSNDIPIDRLDTLDELRERFILHLRKSKGKNRKLKVILMLPYLS